MQLLWLSFRKRQNSPENVVRRVVPKPEGSTNGKPNGPSLVAHESFDAPSPKSNDYEESDGEQDEHLDRRYHINRHLINSVPKSIVF